MVHKYIPPEYSQSHMRLVNLYDNKWFMALLHNWQEYWDNHLVSKYGKEKVETEEDLYLQVARTVNRKPVEQSVFEDIIYDITNRLSFKKEDTLVDICCGNGLFTYQLKDKVAKVVGIDFSAPIIKAAKQFKNADNITYHLGKVIDSLRKFPILFPGIKPNKYLNNDSLAYFSPTELQEILGLIVDTSGKDFLFLVRGVPNAELKWNYYNTEERKERYIRNKENGDHSNDGLGRWWMPLEIRNICNSLGLNHKITNQEHSISNYRMDVLISGT